MQKINVPIQRCEICNIQMAFIFGDKEKTPFCRNKNCEYFELFPKGIDELKRKDSSKTPDIVDAFRKGSVEKITQHNFDGSCNYNDNENGNGHPECRYPYNPNRKNQSGEQCLKLRDEHFDIEAFLIEWERKIDVSGTLNGYHQGLEAGKKQMIDEVEKWNFEYDGRENWIYNLIVHLKSL